jgi:hypothetical protein
VKEIFGAGTSMYAGEIRKDSLLCERRQITGTQGMIIRRPYTIANWVQTVKMVASCQLYKVTIAALNTGLKIIGPLTNTSGLKGELFAVNCVCNKPFI